MWTKLASDLLTAPLHDEDDPSFAWVGKWTDYHDTELHIVTFTRCRRVMYRICAWVGMIIKWILIWICSMFYCFTKCRRVWCCNVYSVLQPAWSHHWRSHVQKYLTISSILCTTAFCLSLSLAPCRWTKYAAISLTPMQPLTALSSTTCIWTNMY